MHFYFSALRPFGGLTIDDGKTGFAIASRSHTNSSTQGTIDGFQLFGAFEVVEIASHGAFGRKVVRKQTPLTSGA